MVAHTRYEDSFWQNGQYVAGIDEVGRGALAGPVVAAAVVFAPDRIPAGLMDSKLLTHERRMKLAADVYDTAVAWHISFVDNVRIDDVNILQATYDAMHHALDGIGHGVEHVLVDGNRFRPHRIPSTCIVRGDLQCASIAAASIIAKTARDEYMSAIAHAMYPQYAFRTNVGYGTVAHRRALLEHGPTPLHRTTFLRRMFGMPESGHP